MKPKPIIMKKISTVCLRFSCLLLILFAITSCKNEALIQRGDSLEVAYNKAKALFDKENYTESAQAFETVIQIARGTDFGEDAQFYLAESYFRNERYLLAAAEYERYISLFPRKERRQVAQFNEALCYYRLSPRFKLDQGYTRKSIEKFQLYSNRYPAAENIQEASKYITELRSKLAKKLYHSADLYMRTDQYEAAIIYYDLTIDQYPESIWAQRSLVDEINAHNVYASRSVQNKQRERYQNAVATYEKFVQLFPNGEYREQADDYVDEARSALADLREPAPSEDTTASTNGNTSDESSK